MYRFTFCAYTRMFLSLLASCHAACKTNGVGAICMTWSRGFSTCTWIGKLIHNEHD
ncbi:hypothetical protein PF010_g21580 [Phytophthora fragariae]|uniref:Uncharacterized protein n=1 Tax=Phytophthora fragariae TaxID=53985 RepID=A0A6A3L1V5_9STRA|nr:hypothetical protein PF003_g13904 [Phytophthora fragariae]KAE9009754.1 hypothetical protein PF011_g10117 [Phytophthora fragariae]KAE9082456.1 hypothetical protein PF010_g21580 [Phytophthora fragariae]KAE9144584.1 hypothetical protein PF006_g10488 [Phytophthora fragariae]KAE9231300.1 hypothetical protein PF004_g10253 [Phytophthora fragariae]